MNKITEEEAKEMYDQSLDEINISDIMSYSTSDILKEVDPVAYNVGFADFVDGLDEAVEGYTDEKDEE